MIGRDASREYDRRASAEFGVPGIVLMENAGRSTAEAILATAPAGTIAIVCGRGNNGGDGYVAARHLLCAGRTPRLVATCPRESQQGPDARVNREAAERLGLVPRILATEAPVPDDLFADCALIVDALLGTGIRGNVAGLEASLIEAMNRSGAPILAVDTPSGLDADTGLPLGVAVRARTTVTFVDRKPGFIPGRAFAGEVIVSGIGVPHPLPERAG